MAERPRILFVHGAWHGAWCWTQVQAELDRHGVASYAIDLPGHGVSLEPLADLYEDAGTVVAAAEAMRGDVVLVGHSYGGAVVSEAMASLEHVAHVVFVAAFALHVGESVLSVLRAMPREEVGLAKAQVAVEPAEYERLGGAMASNVTTLTSIDPALARDVLYGTTDEPVARAAIDRLDTQAMDSFAQPVTGSALGIVPTTYVRCTRDAAVHPSHQEAMANRCDADVVVDSDHSPFLGRPTVLADLLAELAVASG